MPHTPDDYQEMHSDELARERTRLAWERNQYALNRTRLANKRTFLAWSRTALSIMAFGFILERVDVFINTRHLSTGMEQELSMLGIAAFIIGPVMMAIAGWRFYKLERSLGFRPGECILIPELALFLVAIGVTLYHIFA